MKILPRVLLLCCIVLFSCNANNKAYLNYYSAIDTNVKAYVKQLKLHQELMGRYIDREKNNKWHYKDLHVSDSFKLSTISLFNETSDAIEAVEKINEVDTSINLKENFIMILKRTKIVVEESNKMYIKLFENGIDSVSDEENEKIATSWKNYEKEVVDFKEKCKQYKLKYDIKH